MNLLEPRWKMHFENNEIPNCLWIYKIKATNIYGLYVEEKDNSVGGAFLC